MEGVEGLQDSSYSQQEDKILDKHSLNRGEKASFLDFAAFLAFHQA
jgi:hypothetical protein